MTSHILSACLLLLLLPKDRLVRQAELISYEGRSQFLRGTLSRGFPIINYEAPDSSLAARLSRLSSSGKNPITQHFKVL
ncbi:hypothetical protein QUA44_24085 [Microcoleus sp. N9_A2]|uniref:hypothetical protein n=1 Tax=unclassified Microcoleus TaxID=2642155 RepID=UPI002FD26088